MGGIGVGGVGMGGVGIDGIGTGGVGVDGTGVGILFTGVFVEFVHASPIPNMISRKITRVYPQPFVLPLISLL